MKLIIDVGNTNTLFALYNEHNLKVCQWRCETVSKKTADEYAVWLGQLMALEGFSFSAIIACVVASVVPQVDFNLMEFSKRYLNITALMVGRIPLVDIGVQVFIDHPKQLGADRLAAVIGAYKLYGGGYVVVDFGTATTFDIMDENGNFDGGIIAPGPALSMEALELATAKLPRVIVAPPPHVIARNTVHAIQSGIYWGYVSMIEGMIKRIRLEYKKPLGVIATGGLAPLFYEGTSIFNYVVEDLVLEGIVEIHKRVTA